MEKIYRIKELVKQLNYHRNLYYNESRPEISDFEYDQLFDELRNLEQETGLIMTTSPTQTVGYEVKSSLSKVTHNHPMLSLDKTKNINDVIKFLDGKDGVVMAKMDGLTCSVRYLNGKLVSAETRGNGEIGEDILHCAKTIKNLPLEINCLDEVVVDGEVIITYDDFEKINAMLPESERYKNPRNLASGSIRQLDSSIAAKRNMKFIAWKMVKGSQENSFHNRYIEMINLGFEASPNGYIPHTAITLEYIESIIEYIKHKAIEHSYPIDGCVFGYNNIAYGESLGATSHHLRSQLAFKFYDDLYETTLRDMEWTMGKTGALTPTAVFDSVEIDGTEVSRASLHNISIIKSLGLTNNCTIKVFKANQIIPQIDSAEQDGDSHIEIPKHCPICSGETKVVKDNDSEVLVCTNPNCSGKLLGKLAFFVSKKAMDIDGMSEATLEFLINKGWVQKYVDLYYLDQYVDRWARCEGFGKKSVEKLLTSIEKSRNVDLVHFITALSIPGVGSSAAKIIATRFDNDWHLFSANQASFNWTDLDGFGDTMSTNIKSFFREHIDDVMNLAKEMNFIIEEKKTISNDFISGKTFCVTGAFNTMKRSEIEKIITERGGKLSGSVSKKTDYLLTNESNSGSSKAKKAAELGTPIMSEEEFLSML